MIFNLFKSKPTLKELIPDGFVDIHSHILPAIDDGAKDVEESIKLISEMRKIGFLKIIGTPHTYPGLYENTNESIKESYKKLINKFNENNTIKYASEYLICQDLIYKAEEKILLTIDEKHVLVEFSYMDKPLMLYEILFKLIINGFIPVLAHPERYRYLFNNKKEYLKLKKAGCKFQINLLSTVGYYGNDVSKICDYLLEKNYVDFCGSDIHSIRHIEKFSLKLKIKNINELESVIESNLNFK